jgi:MoaA/NifB/PqqE/SkfB family radical SAM enzyme
MLVLFEKHKDCFFMVYTHGTLVDDEVSKRLSELGKVLLCISLEGFRERTDQRRGMGVFDRVVQTMDRLNRDKALFGASLTAARDNAEEILSDEFMDYRKGCIGRHSYIEDGQSMIAPCPNRDHHDELERLLIEFEPEPTDSNAAEALVKLPKPNPGCC